MFLPEIRHTHSPAAHQRILDLHIPAALEHFTGHFPGMPLLPGVVQVDWASRWGQAFFNIDGAFQSLDHLKFQDMIFPDELIQLSLTWQPETARLSFTYTRQNAAGEQQVLSTGRLQFASGAAA